MSTVTPVTDATFRAEVLDSELPVVVDIWATWCGPCKAVAPILDQLAGEPSATTVPCAVTRSTSWCARRAAR